MMFRADTFRRTGIAAMFAAMFAAMTLACSSNSSQNSAIAQPQPVIEPPVGQPPQGRVVTFFGMCDASGAVALSERLFVVADDEDNILRVYDADVGGQPISKVDISTAIDVPLRGKKKLKFPEVDLEAGTRLGDRAYWVSSHGRDSKARERSERLRFFSTNAPQTGQGLEIVGSQYDRLLADLLADPRFARFGLAHASELAPKSEGGLNIEGLTAAPQNSLILGLRNPVPAGKALLVQLYNPSALVENEPADKKATFGPPILLDLGGDGVRSLSYWRNRFLIVAGHYAEGGTSRLYTWNGGDQPALVSLDLSNYNPEGFFSPDERDEILLLSDDGSRLFDGTACKELKNPDSKQFRGVWVTLPKRD